MLFNLYDRNFCHVNPPLQESIFSWPLWPQAKIQFCAPPPGGQSKIFCLSWKPPVPPDVNYGLSLTLTKRYQANYWLSKCCYSFKTNYMIWDPYVWFRVYVKGLISVKSVSVYYWHSHSEVTRTLVVYNAFAILFEITDLNEFRSYS